MPKMNRDQKAAVIEEVATQIRESEAVFAVDYRGISVQQAADLRTRLGEAGASFRVVKNTLTERAVGEAGADALKGLLEGPTAFTFVSGDAAVAAKVLATFRRETELLEFKGGTMGGVALSTEELTALSRLPARDVMHGQLVGMLASPITGLVRGLAALISGLAIQLKQIEEQGLVTGGAPAPEPTPEPEAAAEEPAAEEPAAEEPAAEEPAAEEPAAEEPAAEEPAAEEPQAPESEEEAVPEEEPAAEEPPSEAPGDPVAEAEAVEQETEAPGGDKEPEGGDSAPEADEESKEG